MAPPSDLLLIASVRFCPYDSATSWLEDRARAKGLLEAVLGSPLFAGIAVGRVDVNDFAPVTPAKAVKMVATGRNILARFQDRDADNELMINLDLRANRCEVSATASGAALTNHGHRALDEMVSAMQGCIAEMRGLAGLSDGCVKADTLLGPLEFPRPRPPRQSHRYPGGSVVTFLDPSFHASGASSANPEEIASLTTPAPPAPAETTTNGGVVTVRWAKTCDRDELKRGASAHGLWLADRIKPDVDLEFNELGDRKHRRAFTSEPRGSLTLYNPNNKIGYKAVLITTRSD